MLAWLYVLDAYEGGLPSAQRKETLVDAAIKAGAPLPSSQARMSGCLEPTHLNINLGHPARLVTVYPLVTGREGARSVAEELSREVADVLYAAGWSPGRRQAEAEVVAAVKAVEREVGWNGATIESFPVAVDALREFVGLDVAQDGPGRDVRRRPFAIDPAQVAATSETLADLGRRLRTRLFPIGLEGDHESVLAVDEAGRVFALDHAGAWHLGDSVAAALATLVTGTEPRLLRERQPEERNTPWRMPITRDEAELIAGKWVNDSADNSTSPGVSFTVTVHEFDLGYVVSARPVPGSPRLIDTGLGIIDKFTGERSTWPGLPMEGIIARWRARRAARPQTVWTWDPAERARWDLRHVATPSTVTQLHLASRPVYEYSWVSARSVKGDEPPCHHRLVLEFMRELPVADRMRGYKRCSEAAVISDTLHAEDARRPLTVAPPVTLDEASAELFNGATMGTRRVREPSDPIAGTAATPCWSCAALARHFGITPESR